MAGDHALRADCSRCAALCCVALHMERSAWLGLSKPAGEPCPHLGAEHGCSIHAQRGALGFAGCVNYDCLGAGQRVTQLFAGRSWRAEPALLAPMLEAFFLMRGVHELLELLDVARRLPLSREQRREWRALRGTLAPAGGVGLAELEQLQLGAIRARLTAFLRRLQPLASGADGRRRLPLAPAQPRRMLTPPSTSSALPVVKLEASETR